MNQLTKKVYDEYMRWVEEICELDENKVAFDPEEIVEKVVELTLKYIKEQ